MYHAEIIMHCNCSCILKKKSDVKCINLELLEITIARLVPGASNRLDTTNDQLLDTMHLYLES